MEEILKQADIILVPFPFSDQSGGKRRPALVISNDKFNSKYPDVLVAAITSYSSEDEYAVFIEKKDWKSGVYSTSFVKAWAILPIDKGLVLKRIGRLEKKKFLEVVEKIREIIK